MDDKSIAVIIPTYNRASLLGQTINSVLAQTHQNLDVIIVDDGSTDSTSDVVSQFSDERVHYVYQKNQGGSAARNKGRTYTKAPLLMFLDSDDLLFPQALELLKREADLDPGLGLIGGTYRLIDVDGDELPAESFTMNEQRLVHLSDLVLSCPFIPSATLIRGAWFDKAKGFDVSQKTVQDWDMWLRLSMVGCPMKAVPEPICKYRIHSQSLTSSVDRLQWALYMLDKVYTADELMPEVDELWAEAYARVYISAATRFYAKQQYSRAKSALVRAGILMPDWLRSGRILEALLREGQTVVLNLNTSTYVKTVLENLPTGMNSTRVRRQALARLAAAELFDETTEIDRDTTLKLCYRLVANDIRWFANLGVLSRLAEPLLGQRTTNFIRRTLRTIVFGLGQDKLRNS